jgi:hypothetical protein
MHCRNFEKTEASGDSIKDEEFAEALSQSESSREGGLGIKRAELRAALGGSLSCDDPIEASALHRVPRLGSMR